MSLYTDVRSEHIAALRRITLQKIKVDFMNALRERVQKRLNRPASDFDLITCFASEIRDAYEIIRVKHNIKL